MNGEHDPRERCELDAKQLSDITLSEIELIMPGVVRALGDIYREHIAHESIRFVLFAVPASSYARAVVGTNFRPGETHIVRQILREAGNTLTPMIPVSPKGHA